MKKIILISVLAKTFNLNQFRKFIYSKINSLLFSIFLFLIVLLLGCTSSIPSRPETTADPVLLNDITSRKWKGVALIPNIIPFADTGVYRTNCFSFGNTGVPSEIATYEWKSDIYTNGTDPKNSFFYSTNTTSGLEFTPISDDKFLFVLRFNTTDNSLGFQYTNTDSSGKRYSVSQTLSSIANTVQSNFNGFSIYMPVYVRNININTNVSSLEMNYGINFVAHATTSPQPAWDTIAYNGFGSLNNKNLGNINNILKDQWIRYEEVSDIENGANDCPDF